MSGFYLFSFSGIPISVSFWYVLLLGFFTMNDFSSGNWRMGVVKIACVTFSLLVHEFGHALMAKRYKLAPSVLLHGWGGLCAHQPSNSDREDFFIVSAGPAAGLTLGCIALVGYFVLPMVLPDAPPLLSSTFFYLVVINFVWNILNLFPLWPLDGGKLFRLGTVRWLGARRGEQITHAIGTLLAACVVLCGLSSGEFFITIICGFLGWENYQYWRSGRPSGPVRSKNLYASELLTQAQEALEDQDWREAARLSHQIRAMNNIPDRVLDKVWQILAIATVRQGDYQEALSYVKRAPINQEIAEVHFICLAKLGKKAEARALLQTPEGSRIAQEVRDRYAL